MVEEELGTCAKAELHPVEESDRGGLESRSCLLNGSYWGRWLQVRKFEMVPGGEPQTVWGMALRVPSTASKWPQVWSGCVLATLAAEGGSDERLGRCRDIGSTMFSVLLAAEPCSAATMNELWRETVMDGNGLSWLPIAAVGGLQVGVVIGFGMTRVLKMWGLRGSWPGFCTDAWTSRCVMYLRCLPWLCVCRCVCVLGRVRLLMKGRERKNYHPFHSNISYESALKLVQSHVSTPQTKGIKEDSGDPG